MKITYSKENINSFGGVNFADRIINNTGAYSIIDQTLGNRGSRATFSYSGLIRSYLLMVLCGGECAEDITILLPKELWSGKRLWCMFGRYIAAHAKRTGYRKRDFFVKVQHRA